MEESKKKKENEARLGRRFLHFTIVADEYGNWWMGEAKAGETAEQCRARALAEAADMGFSPYGGFEKAQEGDMWYCCTEGECGPGYAMAVRIDEAAMSELKYITFYMDPEGRIGRLLNTAFLKDASVKAKEMLYRRGYDLVSDDCGEWEPRSRFELREYPGTFGMCVDRTVWAKKDRSTPDDDAEYWQFRGFVIG